MKLFTTLRSKFERFFQDEAGASAIEYAIIAGLIAVAIMVGARVLGTGISDMFSSIATALPAVGSS